MMHHKWIAVAAVLPACVGAQTNLDAAFTQVINHNNDAIARGDSAALHRGMTDDMQWVVGATGTPLSGTELLSAISHVQNPRPEFIVDSVHARDLGGVATVTYRRLQRRRSGTYEMADWTRALEVYVRRRGRWLLVNHSHTWIVQSPLTIPMDSTALAAFVGRYQVGDGIVDDVHFEGGHLVATMTGRSVAFSPDGIAPLIVFERDASGHVIGYVQGAPDGSVRRTRKIQ